MFVIKKQENYLSEIILKYGLVFHYQSHRNHKQQVLRQRGLPSAQVCLSVVWVHHYITHDTNNVSPLVFVFWTQPTINQNS